MNSPMFEQGFMDTMLKELGPQGPGFKQAADTDVVDNSTARGTDMFSGVRALYRMLSRSAGASSSNGHNVAGGMTKNVFTGPRIEAQKLEKAQNGKA
jgi:hypothetical protein